MADQLSDLDEIRDAVRERYRELHEGEAVLDVLLAGRRGCQAE